MIRLPLRSAAIAAAALSMGLAGCVSVLPKSKPAQLYSFVKTEDLATAAPTSAPAAPAATETGLLLGGLGFPRASGGDGILTRTGPEAAYIAEARWVGPAVVLFREAVGNAFGRTGALRIISRGEVGRASAILRLDVRDFEARYADPKAAPAVVVSIDARLTAADGTFISSRHFDAQTMASDNRVGAIVTAFTASTDKALVDAAAWVQAEAATLPPLPVGPGTTVNTSRRTTSTTSSTQR